MGTKPCLDSKSQGEAGVGVSVSGECECEAAAGRAWRQGNAASVFSHLPSQDRNGCRFSRGSQKHTPLFLLLIPRHPSTLVHKLLARCSGRHSFSLKCPLVGGKDVEGVHQGLQG